MPHDHDHDHSELDDLNHQHGVDINLQGEIHAPIEEVWDVLTRKEFVILWFPELDFQNLTAGGLLTFSPKVGNIKQELTIYDVEAPNLLSFDWFGNLVTFELENQAADTTVINFTEWIHYPDDTSARDVTGWLICMQKIAAIVEGREIPETQALYEEYYPDIEALIQEQDTRDL